MMTEKGDGGQDTVSLPPTYAPSEAYTDSPPPAYRGNGRLGGNKVVQVVRHVCFTAIILVLLIGFFVLSSNYIKAKSAAKCDCSKDAEEISPVLLHAGSFLAPPPPPSAAPLVDAKEDEARENNLDLDDGDETVMGTELLTNEEKEQVNEMVNEMEHKMEEEVKELVKEEEEEEEALKDILNAQADHMKKIRLPINMILGDSKLEGKEVNCEVERRRVPIGPGIMSQTILVTCKDEDQDSNPFRPPSNAFPKPPMSLLAPLMKILTSRPGPQPRIVPVRAPMPPSAFQSGPPQPFIRLTPRFIGAPRMSERKPVSLIGLQRGMPVQARSRAPLSPISLSPVPPRSLPFIPFNVIDLPPPPPPPPFPSNMHPATHMEMIRRFDEEDGEPADFFPAQQQQQQQQQQRQEFGPPRDNTVVMPHQQQQQQQQHGPLMPRVISGPNTIRVHTLAAPPQNGPPQPPPRFAPEARRSAIPQQMESQAEILPLRPIQEGDHRKHHLLMVN